MIGSDNGLAPNRRQAIIWTNDDPVQRRIYASLGRNELMALVYTELNSLVISGFLSQRASNAAVEQKVKLLVLLDAMTHTWRHCNG